MQRRASSTHTHSRAPLPPAGECLGALSIGAGQQPLASVRPGQILVTTHTRCYLKTAGCFAPLTTSSRSVDYILGQAFLATQLFKMETGGLPSYRNHILSSPTPWQHVLLARPKPFFRGGLLTKLPGGFRTSLAALPSVRFPRTHPPGYVRDIPAQVPQEALVLVLHGRRPVAVHRNDVPPVLLLHLGDTGRGGAGRGRRLSRVGLYALLLHPDPVAGLQDVGLQNWEVPGAGAAPAYPEGIQPRDGRQQPRRTMPPLLHALHCQQAELAAALQAKRHRPSAASPGGGGTSSTAPPCRARLQARLFRAAPAPAAGSCCWLLLLLLVVGAVACGRGFLLRYICCGALLLPRRLVHVEPPRAPALGRFISDSDFQSSARV